jgi:hypothetical protein
MMTNLGWRAVDDIDGVGRSDKISMALLWHVCVMEWSRNGLDRCWLGGGIEDQIISGSTE